jgi:hypothetical protein
VKNAVLTVLYGAATGTVTVLLGELCDRVVLHGSSFVLQGAIGGAITAVLKRVYDVYFGGNPDITFFFPRHF